MTTCYSVDSTTMTGLMFRLSRRSPAQTNRRRGNVTIAHYLAARNDPLRKVRFRDATALVPSRVLTRDYDGQNCSIARRARSGFRESLDR